MELFECTSPAAKVNKALAILNKEYGVILREGSLHQTIQNSQRKLNWMRNELKDSANNPEWVRESLIYTTAVDVLNLMEGGTPRQYRVDPKTGALVDYQPPRDDSGSGAAGDVSTRPDLYYKSGNNFDQTNRVVAPYTNISPEEMEQTGITPADLPVDNGVGFYVGIQTPGSSGTVVNGEKGKSKVKSSKLRKDGVVKTVKKTETSSEGDVDNKMIFNKGDADNKVDDTGTPISGKEEKQMKEGLSRPSMQRLMESEIEKAQIVMAVQNEIVEKLQRDAEKIANMKIDVLGPIVERIKAEHGLEAADAFRDLITREIDQALDIVMQVKDRINTETLKLTGDLSSAPSIEQDLGAEDPAGAFEFEDEFSADEPELEPLPAEREVKESRKLGIVVESVKGTMGKKFFENVDQMRAWAKENKDKIAKIHKII